ncbi:hypothetical protein QTP88_017806 [Uroleucon formosanum]
MEISHRLTYPYVAQTLPNETTWSTSPEIYDSDHILIKIELLLSKTSPSASPAKWKLKNPNWTLFSQLVDIYVNTNPPTPNGPIENDVTHITSSIINAENIAIGKTNGILNNRKVPWRNPEIRQSIKDKNTALKRFQKTGKIEDRIRLKELRAKTKYLVKRSKASSWKMFTSTIGPKSDPSSVWNKIRSLHGNNKEKQTHIINDKIPFSLIQPRLLIFLPYLQDTILSLAAWSETSGYRCSPSKSQSVIFTRTKKYPSLDISMYYVPIQTSKSIKILGITFDRKNFWNQHLKDLRRATMLRMNILKIISHTSWGANSISLKQIYTSLILSKLEYGSFLFFKSKPSSLNTINTVHNLELRLATGAFRSSPITSLLNISHTPPLNLIRKKNFMLLSARRVQNNLDIHYSIITELQDSNFKFSDIINHECQTTPPWTMDIDINLKLSFLPKSETTPTIYKSELQSILEGYQDHICFFTDGSNTETGVGAAVTFNETRRMLKLPDHCSIY